jgi:hypothetical protein
MGRRPGIVLIAGAAYWVIVFTAGSALGSLRVLLVEPAIGRLPAVLIELPVILGTSWLAARWLVQRFAIAAARHALAMGGIAFALLMASEAALTIALAGNSPGRWIADMATPAGFLGLSGQVAFGLFPWLIRSGLVRG